MTDVADLTARLRMDAGDFSSGSAQAQQAVGGLASAFGGLKSGMDQLLPGFQQLEQHLSDAAAKVEKFVGTAMAMASIIPTVLGSITGMVHELDQMSGGALTAASSLEQYRLSMEAITGSADKAKSKLAELKSEATTSGFKLDELDGANRQLEMMVGNVANVAKLMQVAQGAHVLYGGSLKEIATQIGLLIENANAYDKSATMNIRNLEKMGVVTRDQADAFDAMIKAGKPIEDIKKMLEGIFDAPKFKKAAEEYANSFDGLMQRLDNVKKLAAADIFAPLLSSLEGLLKKVAEFVQTDTFQKWVAGFATAVQEGVKFVGLIINALSILGGFLKDAGMWVWDNFAKPAVQAFAFVAQEAIKLASHLSGLFNALSHLPFVGHLFSGIGDALKDVSKIVNDIPGDFQKNFDKIHSSADKAGKDIAKALTDPLLNTNFGDNPSAAANLAKIAADNAKKSLQDQKAGEEDIIRALESRKRAQEEILKQMDREAAHEKLMHEQVKAQEDLQKAIEGVAKAQKDVEKATREVEKAQRDVEKAIDGVAKAEKDVEKAVKDVAKAHRDVEKAVEDVAKAEKDVQKAIDDVAKAVKNVEKAHDDVEKAVQGVARAEKDVQKAIEAVEKAQKDVEKATKDVEKAQQDVVKATREVEKAHDDVEKAVQNVAKAYEALTKAQEKTIQADAKVRDSADDLSAALAHFNAVASDSITAHWDLYKIARDLTDAQKGLADIFRTQADLTDQLKTRLDAANESYRAQQTILQQLTDKIREQQNLLRAPLEGEGAHTDKLRKIKETIAALELQKNALMYPADGSRGLYSKDPRIVAIDEQIAKQRILEANENNQFELTVGHQKYLIDQAQKLAEVQFAAQMQAIKAIKDLEAQQKLIEADLKSQKVIIDEQTEAYNRQKAKTDALLAALNAIVQANGQVKSSIDAQVGAYDAVHQAAQRVRDAQSAVADATERERDAEARVQDSLVKVQDSLQKVRDAQDKVTEAQDRVKESQDRVKEATDKVREATDHVKDAEDAVKTAQDRVKDATDKVQDAHQKVKDAVDHVKDAEDKVKDAQDKVKDATDHVKDAQNRVGDAIDNVKTKVDAVKTAQDHVADVVQHIKDLENQVAKEAIQGTIDAIDREIAKHRDAAAQFQADINKMKAAQDSLNASINAQPSGGHGHSETTFNNSDTASMFVGGSSTGQGSTSNTPTYDTTPRPYDGTWGSGNTGGAQYGTQANNSGYGPGYGTMANGGIMEFYASGGMSENHVAQIAKGNTMRMWAEPETGGEAYIPLAASKRARSLEILRTTAGMFGFGLEHFAGGGMYMDDHTAGGQEARPEHVLMRHLNELKYRNDSGIRGVIDPLLGLLNPILNPIHNIVDPTLNSILAGTLGSLTGLITQASGGLGGGLLSGLTGYVNPLTTGGGGGLPLQNLDGGTNVSAGAVQVNIRVDGNAPPNFHLEVQREVKAALDQLLVGMKARR